MNFCLGIRWGFRCWVVYLFNRLIVESTLKSDFRAEEQRTQRFFNVYIFYREDNIQITL